MNYKLLIMNYNESAAADGQGQSHLEGENTEFEAKEGHVGS